MAPGVNAYEMCTLNLTLPDVDPEPNPNQVGEFEKAKTYFGRALKASCGSLTEADPYP